MSERAAGTDDSGRSPDPDPMTPGASPVAPDADRGAGWSALIRRPVVRPGRLAAAVGEAAVAFAAATVSVLWSGVIVLDPLDRVGQVSGVAGLDLHFVVLGLLVLAACVVAATRADRGTWLLISRLACAAVAGLTTGLIAAGVLLALRGTAWPLFANSGDSGQLLTWAEDLLAGRSVPAAYPPTIIQMIAGFSELTGDTTVSALRTLQIAGTAAFGPVAYLAWRLLLPPGWALAVVLVAALPLLEPYKPYTTVVLVVLVPVMIAFLQALRRVGTMSWARLAAVGVITGAALGVMFNTYSGWFVWSAPGVVAATLAVFPWRSAAGRGAALVGVTIAGLTVVAAPHLIGILRAAGTTQDRFFYFDTYSDPAYIAMWRNDLPGDPGTWPPPGELAGVGLFTLLLAVGLGVAVAIAGRRTAVLTLACLLGGAWVLRLWFASRMYETGTVQLYPRTSAEILFCLLLLSIFAVRFGVLRTRHLLVRDLWLRTSTDERTTNGHRPPGMLGSAATIGALCAALLLGLSIGSSVADRYMPRADRSVGLLAYVAQLVRQPDGRCADYVPVDGCEPTAVEVVDAVDAAQRAEGPRVLGGLPAGVRTTTTTTTTEGVPREDPRPVEPAVPDGQG